MLTSFACGVPSAFDVGMEGWSRRVLQLPHRLNLPFAVCGLVRDRAGQQRFMRVIHQRELPSTSLPCEESVSELIQALARLHGSSANSNPVHRRCKGERQIGTAISGHELRRVRTVQSDEFKNMYVA